MAKKVTKATKIVNLDKLREIETYEHADKKRTNNPPIGKAQYDKAPEPAKKYAFDLNLDPTLDVVRHINLGSIRHFKLVENNIKQFTQHINLCFFCALF